MLKKEYSIYLFYYILNIFKEKYNPLIIFDIYVQ